MRREGAVRAADAAARWGVSTTRRAAAAALASGAALLGAAGAFAYIQENLVDQGGGDIGLSVAGGALVLRLEQDASFRITDGSDLQALRDSMARWTSLPTSDASITEGPTFDLPDPIDVGAGLANDGQNRVFFAQTDTANRIGSAIAVSFVMSVGGTITDCDIVFNERLYTFSTTTPADPNQVLGATTYDLGEIATHEMGHCLGLDHSAVAGPFSDATGLEVSGFTSGDFTDQATLYPFGTRTIQGRSLSLDDIAGVSSIYPNATLATTTATISGQVLNGATFAKVKGAHVVAVSTSAPDVPIVGAVSGVQAGGPGGGFTITGLPPGDYYLRLEPLVGTSNPMTGANTLFTGFDTSFPWEYYDGPTESGFDVPTDRVAISLAAGQTASGIVFLTNVGAPDPNEPNNTRAQATPIQCENVVSTSLVPIGDVDYYALVVASAVHLDVDVNASRSGSPLDAVLGVFDAAGGPLAFADNTIGLDPIVGLDLPGSGTYYIAVGSFDDATFTGAGALTAGNYTLTLHCSVPKIQAGVCPGRVLYAASNTTGSIVALSDVDRDLVCDGLTTFSSTSGTQQGMLGTRRDGGVCDGSGSATITARWDDSGDFVADRQASAAGSQPDAPFAVTARRSGAEYLYTASEQGSGPVLELLDTNGDFTPDRTRSFTTAPQLVLSMTMDEAGTLYVLDGLGSDGNGAILAFRDLDGDGVADVSTTFLQDTPTYGVIVSRRPGELFAADIFLGEIDRIVDRNGDGIADSVAPFATGLSLDLNYGMTIDDADVLYTVEGGTRILALPDADHDGAADRQVQFSPALDGLAGIAFGPGPPEIVSPPGSYRPVTVAPQGTLLRLTWEDEGPTVPSYNIYEGTIGAFYNHAPLLCHVAGTPDGAGSRHLDVAPTPGPAGRYYLVTASDRCGEGSAGRDSSGLRRPFPAGVCGPHP